MSTDISVTINPPNQIPVSIGAGITRHAPSHAPGASDSLEAYYITGDVIRPSDTGQFVWTGSTGNFVTGAVVRPSETGKFITSGQTGALTGSFYPLSSNPNGYVQGAVVRPSNTGAFLDTGSSQTINSLKNFLIRPTVNGTGVLLSGEGGGAVNTGSLTGAFYPLNANPSGYITGVDLSNYVTQSSTGSFITSGQTGSFVTTNQTGQFVSTGATGNFVTGSVVRPSDTGSFITSSQTGQFVSASSTGSFITSSQTGQFVSTGSTGVFVTGNVVRPSETGVFYPTSNPSGYITGVDLSNYVTQSSTGVFATNDKVVFLTGDQTISGIKNFASRPTVNGTGVLLSGEATASNTGSLTGVFYPLNSNPSGYITGVDLSNYVTTGQTGNFVTGSVVRPSETGNFITTSQTGQFYANSNPSGYATTGYVTGVSGYLQNQISFNRTGGASDFYVTLTGNQTVSGIKNFTSRPTVSGISVLISGDAVDTVNVYGKNDESFTLYKGQPVYIGGAHGSNPLFKLASNTGEFSSSKTIGLLSQNLNANDLGYAITEGSLEGFDTSSSSAGDPMWLGPTGNILYGTGQKPYGLNHLVYLGVVLRSQSPNGKAYVKIQNGFEIEELHKVYAKDATNQSSLLYNSGSGAWFARQITTGDISGISAYALAANTGSFITSSQTGQFVSTGATGSFVISSQTGSFLTTGAADNRYVLQSSTGSFITTGQTGQFLTTGAADARYYSSSNGQVISGYATTGFNDAVTGMAISGDATKTITLFKRVGTITASFTDNTGSAGGSGAVVAVKSAIKTDTQSLASNTWTDISGLSISYTPTSASNKILVVASIQGGCSVANCAAAFRLVRDSTAIGVADAASNRIQASAIAYPVQDGLLVSAAMSVLDAPASTSSITYKVQFRRFYDSGSGTVYVNRSNSDVDATNYARCASTITIYEVIP